MKNHGVRFGVYYGLFSILFTLVLYLVNPSLMFDMKIGTISSILIAAIFMYLAGKAEKADNAGFLSFGEALKPTFLTYVIGSALGVLFMYILMNFIDPSLLDLQKEVAMQMVENMGKMLKANEESMEQMREQAEASQQGFGIGTAIYTWMVSLILPGIIIALIISAIIKKNPESTV